MRKLQESSDKGWAQITVFIEGFESKYGTTSDKWTSKKQTQTWRRVALRGSFVSLFGLLVLCWRGFPLIALVLIFGIYALGERKWELILSALVGFCMGIFTVAWPGLTTLALIYLVAGLVAAAGGLTVLHAIRLRRELKGASLAILDASMSFAFGALLSSLPLSGASAITWVIGMYALGFGLLLDVLAYRMQGRTSAS
ncbi:MAG: DUF308 domain-containing protein [Bacteroidota bacterium]|jgi:uncharacterized membrane protein HdeD (DUF308 family)